ncbi:MAG: ABC transporter substrate-binding protein, partial [Dermatophilaceae bacterium]
VVIDWDYLNVAQGAKLKGKMEWKTVVPKGAVVGSYYVQAINKDAPNPAAARLWQEFLYSDAGQNLWLQGGARPVREEDMVKAGTIDKPAFEALPAVDGTPVFLTSPQSDAAKTYLTANWAKTVG